MGLIKTGLKAAVAVKTAHVVHDRIQRRQQAEWAAQAHPCAMAPSPSRASPQQAGQYAMAPAQSTIPQQATSPPVATAPGTEQTVGSTSTMLSELKQLGELRSSGVLTKAEF